MKSILLDALQILLRWMAQSVLAKYRPMIVGVTGSVGKSSTKEAIALLLKGSFAVRSNEENYNNEIGIPLTIIGVKSGKSSMIGWIKVGIKWLWVMVSPARYPEVLVLELGIDRPKDMKYLMSFLPVSIGVMTNVSSSHLEFFKTVGHIAKEKGVLLQSLPAEGTAIVCADDALAMKASRKTKARVISYGISQEARVRAENITIESHDAEHRGCYFKVKIDGKTLPVHIPKVVAEHHILAVLAGFSVGIALKIPLLDLVVRAQSFQSLPGRMRLIEGYKHSFLLDDTYNASPASLRAALATLKQFNTSVKRVVLGDMLELGSESETAHTEVAEWIIDAGVSEVTLVGSRMLLASKALYKKGFDTKHCQWFENPLAAMDIVREMIRAGEVILVKGSQGMRMEKVTEVLLAHPEEASLLLCRQSSDWKRKPWKQV
jgi:UDP-N-acetylmuramyl pentapeptide synthase